MAAIVVVNGKGGVDQPTDGNLALLDKLYSNLNQVEILAPRYLGP